MKKSIEEGCLSRRDWNLGFRNHGWSSSCWFQQHGRPLGQTAITSISRKERNVPWLKEKQGERKGKFYVGFVFRKERLGYILRISQKSEQDSRNSSESLDIEEKVNFDAKMEKNTCKISKSQILRGKLVILMILNLKISAKWSSPKKN